jgi:hypothetical protein
MILNDDGTVSVHSLTVAGLVTNTAGGVLGTTLTPTVTSLDATTIHVDHIAEKTSHGIVLDNNTTLQKNQNTATEYQVRNDTNNTAACARCIATYGAYSQYVQMAQLSPSFTTNGLLVASSSVLFSGGSTAGLRVFTSDNYDLILGTNNTARLTIAAAGGVTVVGAFGCNAAAAQTAYASGGALAAYATGAYGLNSDVNMSALHALVVKMRAALVANGILS